MNKIPMSRAGSALLRALLARAGAETDRILLSEARSCDWQSLTLAGERHCFSLRVPGPDAEANVAAIIEGLEDAEFVIPGLIVADIALAGTPQPAPDGSLTIAIEALTIAE